MYANRGASPGAYLRFSTSFAGTSRGRFEGLRSIALSASFTLTPAVTHLAARSGLV